MANRRSPLTDGTERDGWHVRFAKGSKCNDPDTVLLQRLKNVLGLSEREIGENLLGCKRELVSAYLTGRARFRFSDVERDRVLAAIKHAREELAMIEMSL